jgi:hypothetical protein
MAALLEELSGRLNWNFGYACGFWRGGVFWMLRKQQGLPPNKNPLAPLFINMKIS